MKRIFAALSVLALAAPLAVCQAKVTTCEVNLTWDAPLSSPDPVSSYDAFRAPSGGTSYQQLNTTAITSTTYSDLTVQASTYDYIVESVDASGVTSAPSNVASVVVPALPPSPSKPTVKFNP